MPAVTHLPWFSCCHGLAARHGESVDCQQSPELRGEPGFASTVPPYSWRPIFSICPDLLAATGKAGSGDEGTLAGIGQA